MTKLTIGTQSSKLALWQAAYTQAELTRIGVESSLLIIEDLADKPTGEQIVQGVRYSKTMEAALSRGEIDVAVHDMKHLSSKQAEGLAITAVSARSNPADCLLIRREALEDSQVFKVKNGGKLAVSSKRQATQMSDYRPDLQISEVQTDIFAQLEKLSAGTFDALLLAAVDVAQLEIDHSDLEMITLNPREFVPAPAQGVIAWQCNRDDLETRRIFRQIHQTNVSACTNIERRVLQLMDGINPGTLGVHCERDAAGNFHCAAACAINGRLHRMQLSSSTSFGVAEKIVAGLKS